jgi:hypothetical protein
MPLVTTSAGAKGMEGWEGKAFLIADDSRMFSEAICSILESEDVYERLAEGALEFTLKSNKSAMNSLIQVIENHCKMSS